LPKKSIGYPKKAVEHSVHWTMPKCAIVESHSLKVVLVVFVVRVLGIASNANR
jgi:hypothetical protein